MALALKATVGGLEIVMVNGHAAKMMREEIANGKKTGPVTYVNKEIGIRKQSEKGFTSGVRGRPKICEEIASVDPVIF